MMKCALQKDPFPSKVRECVSVLEVPIFTPLFVDFFHCPILFLSFFLPFFLSPASPSLFSSLFPLLLI